MKKQAELTAKSNTVDLAASAAKPTDAMRILSKLFEFLDKRLATLEKTKLSVEQPELAETQRPHDQPSAAPRDESTPQLWKQRLERLEKRLDSLQMDKRVDTAEVRRSQHVTVQNAQNTKTGRGPAMQKCRRLPKS